MREVVDQLETESVFADLVSATREAFSGRDSKMTGRSIWEHAIRNFFRRSGFYFAASRLPRLRFDRFVSEYEQAFTRQTETVTFLAPMELVRLTKSCVTFEGFSVRRFSQAQLERLLEAETNRVFYRWATTHVAQLVSYWFICLTVKRRCPTRLAGPGFNLADIDKVEPYQVPFPSLEAALRALVLYRWQWDIWREDPLEAQEGWMGFRVPFVLRLSDDLLEAPAHAPDLRRLVTRPVVDPVTDEELGEEPEVAIDLNEQETGDFERTVRAFAKQLSILNPEKHDWRFFSVASGYLVKAFFAKGMEQLLWHITTLEALLGDRSEGIVQQVATRISAIVGSTKRERKAVSRRYKRLYDFRSALVHGRDFQRQVLTAHLREARDLARAACGWMLACLAHFQRAGGGGGHPTRKDILRLLDLDQASKYRWSKVLRATPPDFPRSQGWGSP